jgi:hypothetical protein
MTKRKNFTAEFKREAVQLLAYFTTEADDCMNVSPIALIDAVSAVELRDSNHVN